ncbi:PEP/pyruvate-binding domain-containing protein [Specibacter sp. RAF43]|uniref:PEP/pyruvate-binding domain-containing protein n=1 Tax=Specibacter sp. RAF43 TaxID=3233057 RepID=UPI003F962FAE
MRTQTGRADPGSASVRLDDVDVVRLGRWAVQIESHYGHPMDMEWAKDGITGELFIV